MEQQYPLDFILFFIIYGGATMLAFMASIYLLLLRPVSVFNIDITPPLRLRRWMSATFASVAVSHLWWLFLYYYHGDADPTGHLLFCRCLDVLLNWSVTFHTMLVMLQDRRRTQLFRAISTRGDWSHVPPSQR